MFRLGGLLAVFVAVSAGCEKFGLGGVSFSDDEVIFTSGGLPGHLSTKASVVNDSNLTSIYVAATTGSAGSESSAWSSYQFNRDGEGVFSGVGDGKMWPSSNPGYHFYASNVALSFAAGGMTVSAATSTDVVCAYLPDPVYKAANTLTFEHIFARIGSVTVSAESGYAVSGVSIRIVPKTAGTYNLRTGEWTGLTAGSSTEIANATPGTKSNDLYLVPGAYEVLATWTAAKGDYSQTFTDMPVDVFLEAGKVSALSIELGGLATEIKFRTVVLPWDTETQMMAFPMT